MVFIWLLTDNLGAKRILLPLKSSPMKSKWVYRGLDTYLGSEKEPSFFLLRLRLRYCEHEISNSVHYYTNQNV